MSMALAPARDMHDDSFYAVDYTEGIMLKGTICSDDYETSKWRLFPNIQG